MSLLPHDGGDPSHTQPIRVLHLAKGLGPGGAERLIVNQVQASDDPLIDYTVGYARPDKDHLVGELTDLGTTVALINQRTLPLALATLIRRTQPDVVHVHSPIVAASVRTLVFLRVIDVPIVVTEHNRWPRHHWMTRLANRLTSPLDSVRIAVSEDVRSSMTPSIAASTHVLDHGVPLDHIRRVASDRDRQRTELFGEQADDVCVIGIVANFRPEKGYDTFLDAAEIVAGRNPRLRLVVVGQGPGEERFRAAAASHDHIYVLGYRSDAHHVMSAFDVFTLSSRHEGKPVALMEAFALGLPVVATRAGGIPEAVDDEVNGLLVNVDDAPALADAWLRICSDSQLRSRLAQAAAESAATFDASGSTKSIEAWYRSVITAGTR